MTELKPCPFCGGSCLPIPKSRYNPDGEITIVCAGCSLEVGYFALSIEPDQLIEMWNRRVNSRDDVPKKMCANCKYCSEYGVRSDIDCTLTKSGKNYYDVCEEWEAKK